MSEIFNGKYLGICESLLYVSREEIENRIKNYPGEVNSCAGSLRTLKDYLNLECGFIYRFPYKEELNDIWDEEHKEHEIVISVDPQIVKISHSNFIQTEINGQTYNLPFCPASEKAEKLGVKKINQWLINIKVYGQKYTVTDPEGYTLFECAACGSVFALDRSKTLYIRKRLKENGMEYEANLIKYKTSDILCNKSKQLQSYANKIDNEGLIYSYKDTLSFIKSLEDEEDRDIPIEELEEYLSDNQFCGV